MYESLQLCWRFGHHWPTCCAWQQEIDFSGTTF
jgi:hypothetical protein